LNTAVYQEAIRKQRKAQTLAENRIPLPINTPSHPQETTITVPYTQHTQQFIPQKQVIMAHPQPIRPVHSRHLLPPRPTPTPQAPLQAISTNPIIQQYLTDPAIQSIECHGPGKPLVVMKQNKLNVTTTLLDAETIKSILTEVSQKTKIPLEQGLYKALLGTYIVTGVISDVIGDRFIIQRRA
jgi:hypothetical protein